MSYTVEYGGERLDIIARKMLRTASHGAVEALLEANPGLADLTISGLVPGDTVIQPPAAFVAVSSVPVVLAWE